MVIADVDAAVVHYNPVWVVIDVVMLDPRVPTLDAEDALGPAPVDEIVKDDGVCWVCATVRNIGFVILENFILFNVGAARVDHEDALAIIAEDLVVHDFYWSLLARSDASLSIWADMVILFYSAEVLVSLK